MKENSSASRYIWFGVLITFIWIAFGAVYLRVIGGFPTLLEADFNAVGDFSAGFFAPLAFVWFVLAILMQSHQLKLQAEELALQRAELADTRKTLEAQAEAVSRNTNHAAQDTFLQTFNLLEGELNEILVQIRRETRSANNPNDLRRLWEQNGNGNRYVFCEHIISHFKTKPPNFKQAMQQTERYSLARRFRAVFEKIFSEIEIIDDSRNSIRGIIEWSPYGETYAIFCALDPQAKAKFAVRSPGSVNYYRDLLDGKTIDHGPEPAE